LKAIKKSGKKFGENFDGWIYGEEKINRKSLQIINLDSLPNFIGREFLYRRLSFWTIFKYFGF
jgi:hypothetical protein